MTGDQRWSFFYCRDVPGTDALLQEFAEAHWAFMDGYAEMMIARGPTTDPAGEIHPGSVHMADLADSAGANAFAFEEPYYRAGVYSEVLKRRWRDVLGRRMGDFAGAEGLERFLIIGHGADVIEAVPDQLVARRRRYLQEGGYLDRFIDRGPLLSDDGERWMGSAMLVELQGRSSVDAMLAQDPYVLEGLCTPTSRCTPGDPAADPSLGSSPTRAGPSLAL